jgi:RNA polymerase sigma-70 factor (ECF subfamily)
LTAALLLLEAGPGKESTIFQRLNPQSKVVIWETAQMSSRRTDNSGKVVRFGAASSGFRQRTALPDEDGSDALLSKAIQRAREGDRDAVSFLYVRYADNIYGYVRSIVRDEHEAEDITQQLFSKLGSALSRYQPQRVPFSAWILRVARNLALDHMRAMRSVPCAEVRPVESAADDLSFERARALQDALDTLPREQRQVLILRHVAGMTPGEIARSLGKSEGSIHGLHHRGRRTLQRELSELGAQPVTSRRSAGSATVS